MPISSYTLWTASVDKFYMQEVGTPVTRILKVKHVFYISFMEMNKSCENFPFYKQKNIINCKMGILHEMPRQSLLCLLIAFLLFLFDIIFFPFCCISLLKPSQCFSFSLYFVMFCFLPCKHVGFSRAEG